MSKTYVEGVKDIASILIATHLKITGKKHDNHIRKNIKLLQIDTIIFQSKI